MKINKFKYKHKYNKYKNKSKKRIVYLGYIKIKTTLNNIFVTITDKKGNVLVTKNAGSCGFKGTQKRSSYIAARVAKQAFLDFKKKKSLIRGFILQLYGNIKHHSLQSIVYQLNSLRRKAVLFLENINLKGHNGLRKAKSRRL
jgi:ribosomal protein S11